jgi:hypothetical protein
MDRSAHDVFPHPASFRPVKRNALPS